MSIVEFLLARVAEDEAVAHAAGDAPWLAMESAPWVQVDPAAIRDAKWRFGKQGHVATADTNFHADHIARHDPARVLRQCEAMRRVVDMMSRVVDEFGKPLGQRLIWPDINRRERHHANEVLYALAAIWADHPDYDPAWGDA